VYARIFASWFVVGFAQSRKEADMENNRNLSSIISKIRDEGPPGNGSAAAAGAAEPLSAPATTAGHRTSRKLLLGLVLPLVAVVGVVLFAGSYTGYRDNGGITGITSVVGAWLKTLPGSAEDGVVTGGIVAATGAVDEQLVRDLQVQQLDIMFRLDQLTDSVAALSETINKNWADNDTVITGLRQEQRAAIDAIEARVTALQTRLAGVTGKPAGKDASPAARSAPKTTAASAKAPAVPAKAPDAKVKAEQAVAGEEWVVNIASSSHEQAMLDMAAKLREQGIPVERQALTIEGDLMYRLRVPGFATSAEARSYAGKLDKEFGLRGGWVSRK
jgi:cell division septation protein DedD